jgi:hypothetical protein
VKSIDLVLVLIYPAASFIIDAKSALSSDEVTENSWNAKSSGIHCEIEGLIA